MSEPEEKKPLRTDKIPDFSSLIPGLAYAIVLTIIGLLAGYYTSN